MKLYLRSMDDLEEILDWFSPYGPYYYAHRPLHSGCPPPAPARRHSRQRQPSG
jgi:hypothetical protein